MERDRCELLGCCYDEESSRQQSRCYRATGECGAVVMRRGSSALLVQHMFKIILFYLFSSLASWGWLGEGTKATFFS